MNNMGPSSHWTYRAQARGSDARTVSPAESIDPELQRFEQLLASGGDERIAVDPSTGRNRYGTPREWLVTKHGFLRPPLLQYQLVVMTPPWKHIVLLKANAMLGRFRLGSTVFVRD